MRYPKPSQLSIHGQPTRRRKFGLGLIQWINLAVVFYLSFHARSRPWLRDDTKVLHRRCPLSIWPFLHNSETLLTRCRLINDCISWILLGPSLLPPQKKAASYSPRILYFFLAIVQILAPAFSYSGPTHDAQQSDGDRLFTLVVIPRPMFTSSKYLNESDVAVNPLVNLRLQGSDLTPRG